MPPYVDKYGWQCQLTADEVSFKQVGQREVIRFALERFLVDGELPGGAWGNHLKLKDKNKKARRKRAHLLRRGLTSCSRAVSLLDNSLILL